MCNVLREALHNFAVSEAFSSGIRQQFALRQGVGDTPSHLTGLLPSQRLRLQNRAPVPGQSRGLPRGPWISSFEEAAVRRRHRGVALLVFASSLLPAIPGESPEEVRLHPSGLFDSVSCLSPPLSSSAFRLRIRRPRQKGETPARADNAIRKAHCLSRLEYRVIRTEGVPRTGADLPPIPTDCLYSDVCVKV